MYTSDWLKLNWEKLGVIRQEQMAAGKIGNFRNCSEHWKTGPREIYCQQKQHPKKERLLQNTGKQK